MSRPTPVLLVGLPRSGTSWVGAVLGAAPTVEYLREPITQEWLVRGGTTPMVDPHQDNAYEELSVATLSDGATARLIKEVNPYLVPFCVENGLAEVLLLHRHPCAVALSYFERGWTNLDLQRRFGVAESGDYWFDHGSYQALHLNSAVRTAAASPHAQVISYESLTADPVAAFSHLAAQLGIDWGPVSFAHLESTLTDESRSDPYALTRDAAAATRRWQDKLTPSQQSAVVSGYAAHADPTAPTPPETLPR